MSVSQLEGRRILLVEDEYFQARELKEMLEDIGAEVVGPTASADEVPAMLESAPVDAALIDINLGDGPSFRTAELLKRKGVPFAFVTGYDQENVPADLKAVPRIEKPARQNNLITLLSDLL